MRVAGAMVGFFANAGLVGPFLGLLVGVVVGLLLGVLAAFDDRPGARRGSSTCRVFRARPSRGW